MQDERLTVDLLVNKAAVAFGVPMVRPLSRSGAAIPFLPPRPDPAPPTPLPLLTRPASRLEKV